MKSSVRISPFRITREILSDTYTVLSIWSRCPDQWCANRSHEHFQYLSGERRAQVIGSFRYINADSLSVAPIAPLVCPAKIVFMIVRHRQHPPCGNVQREDL